MKKLALFLGGVVVGYMGCCGLLAFGNSYYDETIYETDKYNITKATDRGKNLDVAIINYK